MKGRSIMQTGNRFRVLLASVLALCALCACKASAQASAQATPAPAQDATLPLIPLPASLERGQGSFRVSAATPVLAKSETAEKVARQFAD
jgi:hypothetical protein